MDFRKYIREKIKKNDQIIEFGPLNRPLFTKEEFKNIYYADIRSTEEIKNLYSGNDYLNKTGISIDINTIVDVDYKITKSYKETFKDKKFNVAYLSHVIEHMPSIIDFFKDIFEVLDENGLLVIIYPDKRYCFDHFRNEVSFRDAYATYKYGLKENARIAFDFAYNVIAENDAPKFWHDKNVIDEISKAPLDEGIKYYNDILNGKSIDDVHLWPFSDYGFLKFIYEMQRAKLLNFTIEEFYPTQDNTQEFLIILKKDNSNDYTKTLELLKEHDESFNTQIKLDELTIKNNEYQNELNTFNERKEIEINTLIEKHKIEEKALKEKYDLDLKSLKEEYNLEQINLINNFEDKIKEELKTINNYQTTIELLEKNIKDLENEINKVYNSTSMKITKPLRQIKNFFIEKK